MTDCRRMIVALSVLACPGLAGAQACIGIPSEAGQVVLSGSFFTTDGANGYGGNLGGNLGSAWLHGSYGRTKFEGFAESGSNVGALLAYELPIHLASACPMVGVGHFSWSDEISNELWESRSTDIQIGVGVGKSLVGPTITATVAAVPHMIVYRNEATLQSPFRADREDRDNGREFGADLLVALSSRMFFVQGGVTFTTFDNADPVFSVGIGLLLGGGGR